MVWSGTGFEVVTWIAAWIDLEAVVEDGAEVEVPSRLAVAADLVLGEGGTGVGAVKFLLGGLVWDSGGLVDVTEYLIAVMIVYGDLLESEYLGGGF